jgi:hypothetical protein
MAVAAALVLIVTFGFFTRGWIGGGDAKLAAAPAWARTSVAAIPLINASAKKPPTRTIDTRLEIVMVSRSLEAANAIIVGNSINLTESMIMISPIKTSLAPERPIAPVNLALRSLRIG